MNDVIAKPGATRRSGGSADVRSASGAGRKPGTAWRSGVGGKHRATWRGRSVVPYNPGLHALVTEKRAGAKPLRAADQGNGFLGWHQRGYLPHRDAPGLVQLVTFRLADAMPASRRSEWEALLRIETQRERRRQLEAYLDRGLGACWLGRPELARVMESALRFFDGERYRLRAWVVVPNHVHVLVETSNEPLARVIQSWKTFTAKAVNRRVGRRGPVWEREYWDTWMRDEIQERNAVRYIENNPVKARLVREPSAWRWSSARLRDGYGRLEIAAGAPACPRFETDAAPASRVEPGAPARVEPGAPGGESRVEPGAPEIESDHG